MFSIMKRPLIVGAMLLSTVMAQTQASGKRSRCKATKGRRQSFETIGRVFVDVQDLTRITKGP